MKPDEIASKMALNPQITYLDHAAFSPLPKRTKMVMERQLTAKAIHGTLSPEFSIQKFVGEEIPRTKGITAELIGGDVDGIAFTRSTLQGIHTVVEGFPWNFGDNMVINDLEFTTNSYVHQVVSKKQKISLRVVPNQNGILNIEDFETAIDSRTKLVAISLVQFSNGYRAPIEEIANLIHDVGGYLLVDGIQAVGALPVNCRELGIDALAAGAYKWALGPFGTGFLWISDENDFRRDLKPSFVGWWSAKDGIRNMSHCKFDPAPDGQHFEPSPYFEISGMVESFQFLLDIGLHNVWSNIKSTTDYLIKRCEENQIHVFSPIEPSQRSGIVSIGWHGIDPLRIAEDLHRQNIAISPRSGALRVSPHAYNSKKDIDHLIDALQSYREN